MLAAAGELRRAHPVLARLNARWVRSLLRPFFAAGWTVGDVLHALCYRPSATSTLPSMSLGRVYAPAGWARSRLAAWRDETGRVVPGEHQHQAALAEARARHGRAAGAALPFDEVTLREEHVSAHAARFTEGAAEAHARSQRRDEANRRAGLVPYAQHGPSDPRRTTRHEPAGTARTRREAMTALRDQLARRRARPGRPTDTADVAPG
jgi:hypothetical protein